MVLPLNITPSSFHCCILLLSLLLFNFLSTSCIGRQILPWPKYHAFLLHSSSCYILSMLYDVHCSSMHRCTVYVVIFSQCCTMFIAVRCIDAQCMLLYSLNAVRCSLQFDASMHSVYYNELAPVYQSVQYRILLLLSRHILMRWRFQDVGYLILQMLRDLQIRVWNGFTFPGKIIWTCVVQS